LLLSAALLVSLAGVGFSFFGTSFWPSIMWFVPHSTLGAAYGMMCSFQNMGLALFPLVVAALEPPRCTSFECVSLLFAALATTGALLSIWAHVLERQNAAAAGDTRGGFSALVPARCRSSQSFCLPDDRSAESDWEASEDNTPSICVVVPSLDSGVDLLSPRA
jgi:hypothetical protein